MDDSEVIIFVSMEDLGVLEPEGILAELIRHATQWRTSGEEEKEEAEWTPP